MKTLVIHPEDSTTDVLCVIYEGKDWTVIRDIPHKSALIEAINAHDRIIMLGHGTPQGLINTKQKNLAIDSTFVYLLKDKPCVCIWCNADMFVNRYKLKGIYTGMIVSEYHEALIYDIVSRTSDIDEITKTYEQIAISNEIFSSTMRDIINEKVPLNEAVAKYVDETSPIITYNRERIYRNDLETSK